MTRSTRLDSVWISASGATLLVLFGVTVIIAVGASAGLQAHSGDVFGFAGYIALYVAGVLGVVGGGHQVSAAYRPPEPTTAPAVVADVALIQAIPAEQAPPAAP